MATIQCITIDTLLDGTLPKIRTGPSQLRLAAKYHARAELIEGDHKQYFDLVNLHCRVVELLFLLLSLIIPGSLVASRSREGATGTYAFSTSDARRCIDEDCDNGLQGTIGKAEPGDRCDA